MSEFTVTITQTIMVEVEVEVTLVGHYVPAQVYGPPEDCYPEDSDMEVTDVKVLEDLDLKGLAEATLSGGEELDKVITAAWSELDAA
jgi:hypothetical protein